MFHALQVKVNKLVQRSTLEKSQDLRQGETSCDSADKWRTDCLTSQESDTAAIEITVVQHFLIGGAAAHVLVSERVLPKVNGGASCG